MTASTPAVHRLDNSVAHFAWDNQLAPRLTVDSGDTVVLETIGGSGNYYTPHSTSEDVARKPPFKGHALTGPVSVRGARPGDALRVDVVEVRTWDWGHTAVSAGKGLLPEEIPGPYLQLWDLSNGKTARLRPGIEVPLAPFLGVIGLALAEPGEHSTNPPRRVGGNLDVKQLVAGSTLWLPVEVEGALLSVGDAHAAQGDGEVCINAIETGATATLRLTVVPDHPLPSPRFRTPGPLVPETNTGPWTATTGIGPDLMEATRDAVRAMIGYLGQEHGLSREEAYVLCSVGVDLKISEVVDAPNGVVSAFLPDSLFTA